MCAFERCSFLVTGGAGFIGSHLVQELVSRGHSVRVLDNFSTGRRENLAHLTGRVEVVDADVRDAGVVREAVRDIDYVLHQAALPSVTRSVHDPVSSNEVNVAGTLNVLVAARDEGVRRVVYASSSSVYGDSPLLPKQEDMPTNPLSPYAVSKLAGENYCRSFYRVYGLPTVCLRYFNVFGMRQDPNSQYAAVIPRFIVAALGGQPLRVYGDGTQSRDFTYVANVVRANLLACVQDAAIGQVINVACGERHSLLDLIGLLRCILQRDLIVDYERARPGDVQHSLADITRAREVLGYDVVADFKTGLTRTAEWYRENVVR